MVNKSRGEMAYTLVDVESAVGEAVLESIRAHRRRAVGALPAASRLSREGMARKRRAKTGAGDGAAPATPSASPAAQTPPASGPSATPTGSAASFHGADTQRRAARLMGRRRTAAGPGRWRGLLAGARRGSQRCACIRSRDDGCRAHRAGLDARRGELRGQQHMPGLPRCRGRCLETVAPRHGDGLAERADRARQFRQCELQASGHHHPLLQARRQVLRQYRRPRRQASRLRSGLHLRRRAAAADT